jgi:hypothetical protein
LLLRRIIIIDRLVRVLGHFNVSCLQG